MAQYADRPEVLGEEVLIIYWPVNKPPPVSNEAETPQKAICTTKAKCS